MAMTLMIENINNDFTVYPTARSDARSATPQGSYYKFYQTKLRQLVTQTRYRKEQEVRINRQKQSKQSTLDQRLSEQRLHKEYMNHIRERSKIQVQDILSNKLEESRKSTETIMSNTNRALNLSVTSSTMSTTTMESRTKAPVKPRQVPISAKQQSSRIISVSPPPPPSNVNKPKIIPRTTIDHCEENHLSKSNMHSFTQATSSSFSHNPNHQHARQSILNNIMLHLNRNFPSNQLSKSTFDDIDQKFSSSIAPNVYEDFKRIAA